ncbi:peptide chain release factor N(5)-glutamine methyltransferase [Candidatus Peregrinibacteria bacterium]|nr:peptide chain release factor N(5)-glutamine methyltransferase [Candidatus Peregrinibacteria bacterium]
MNVSCALSDARAILSDQTEAEILLSFAMRRKREFLISHPEAKILPTALRRFRMLSAKRSSGVPIAYLTGHKEFYGLDFCMEPGVFIPRPETEILVEEVFNVYRKNYELRMTNYKLRICDIGTGSGCLAITLAKHLSKAHVTAVDISPKALKLAKKNAQIHSVADRITFFKSDLLDVIASKVKQSPFDIIITNLPYIGLNEDNFVSKEVLDYEPAQALFGGETGLELFEKLFQQIIAMRFKPQWLIAEIGFSQQQALAKLIKKYFGNTAVLWKNDLAGLPRMFTIFFNKSASLRSA